MATFSLQKRFIHLHSCNVCANLFYSPKEVPFKPQFPYNKHTSSTVSQWKLEWNLQRLSHSVPVYLIMLLNIQQRPCYYVWEKAIIFSLAEVNGSKLTWTSSQLYNRRWNSSSGGCNVWPSAAVNATQVPEMGRQTRCFIIKWIRRTNYHRKHV